VQPGHGRLPAERHTEHNRIKYLRLWASFFRASVSATKLINSSHHQHHLKAAL
jgi:hypothetical protein